MTVQPVQYAPPQAYQQARPQYQRRRLQGISLLVHGPAKYGKSSLADSGPKPGVILDVEGTSYWTPSRKIYWDPKRETPPYPDGSWDSAIVLAREASDVFGLYRILNSGQHWFKSCSIDSVTEVQQRVIDDLTGGKSMDQAKWGTLLRQISTMTRQYRDLITHPTNPLWTVSFTAGTHMRDGRWRPLVQGQSQDFLPYYVDLLGYLNALPDGRRQLLIGPHPLYETGERVGGRLPYDLLIGYGDKYPGYTMESMLRQVLS